MKAYLGFSQRDAVAEQAKAIALRYANHPVDRWKQNFAEIRQQLDEAEGKEPSVVDGEDPTQVQARLAATEPSLELGVEGPKATLTVKNVKEVKVNYYLMDLELLFSTNPFVQQVGGQFGLIKRAGRTRSRSPPASRRSASTCPRSSPERT